jgi:hypothetical protein
MRIGRTVLIPVILSLSVAGAVLAGSEMSAAVVHTASVHAQQVSASAAKPGMKMHG